MSSGDSPADAGGDERIGPSSTYCEPDEVRRSRAETRTTMAVECHGLFAEAPA
jgi:hypothetical protein